MADFSAVFNQFLDRVAAYNTQQKESILKATKTALGEVLSEIGQPFPEPTANPAPAQSGQASAAAATSAGPTGAGNSNSGTSVTGAKPSSRVLQAAGGTSTINLGGGDDKPTTSHGRKQYGNSNTSSIAFGASDEAKTSVKVHHAPGGGSSIQFGDDSSDTNKPTTAQRKDRLQADSADDAASRPKKHGTKKMIHAAGGETHDIFNQNPNQKSTEHSSTKVHAAPGGSSNFSLAHDSTPKKEAEPAAAPAAASGEASPALVKDIIAAVYRKGKVKDTFTKFTGNKGKNLATDELKVGIESLGIKITDAQTASIMAQFTKDPKAGMSYPDFMKMMSA